MELNFTPRAIQQLPVPWSKNQQRRAFGPWMTLDLRRWRPLLDPVFLAMSLLTGLAVMGAAGYRINLTPSMPLGLWRVVAPSPTDYQRGQGVMVCPPMDAPFLPRGSCSLGMQPLLKQLVALPGDIVTVTSAGVSINGGPLLPHSAPLSQDSAGRPLPQQLGTWRLTGYWLYGAGSPRSFDSRYFGEVPAAALGGVVQPVVLFCR
jgi:conjugative transfer signal peptidase TraF